MKKEFDYKLFWSVIIGVALIVAFSQGFITGAQTLDGGDNGTSFAVEPPEEDYESLREGTGFSIEGPEDDTTTEPPAGNTSCGSTPHGVARRAINQIGPCSGNQEICDNGEWKIVEGGYIPEGEMKDCNFDHIDNDCDGVVDYNEAVTCPISAACGNGFCDGADSSDIRLRLDPETCDSCPEDCTTLCEIQNEESSNVTLPTPPEPPIDTEKCEDFSDAELKGFIEAGTVRQNCADLSDEDIIDLLLDRDLITSDTPTTPTDTLTFVDSPIFAAPSIPSFCGDDSCDSDESCSLCNVDCGECPELEDSGEVDRDKGVDSGDSEEIVRSRDENGKLKEEKEGLLRRFFNFFKGIFS